MQRIHDLVAEHVPHMILVANVNAHCEALKNYLEVVQDYILKDNARVLTGRSETGTISVKFFDQTVAQLWENSVAAKEELTDQPVLVRRAVAMARVAIQGPLPVLCSLAGEFQAPSAFIPLKHMLGKLCRPS